MVLIFWAGKLSAYTAAIDQFHLVGSYMYVLQYSTLQYSTVQYSTLQYSTL